MAKHSSAANNCHELTNKQQKGIDIISQLPDELLILILSLLPAADVTRSRILSNRWKHLWVYLPNLHFVIPGINKHAIINYINSIDQALALRGGTPIQKLFLQYSHHLKDYHVNNWLREVEQLEFRFYIFDSEFCRNLFRYCNNTLIKLTLQGFVVLLTPAIKITFPCLKEMNLHSIEYCSTNSLMFLLSGCPVLEELCLDKLGLCDILKMVRLSSQSIRRLTIKRINCKYLELVIDAPKLEYLHFSTCFFRGYSLIYPSSIIEAHIDKSSDNVIQLLRCISSTKKLTLTRQSLLALGFFQNINLPMFPNLVKLEMAWERNLLLSLLNNMPNLEYLTFSHGLQPAKTEWNPPMEEEAPACLRFKLKEIFVVSYVQPEEIAIISYLLKHANNLKKLTISKVDPEWRDQWLNIHRVSKSSLIEFVQTLC